MPGGAPLHPFFHFPCVPFPFEAEPLSSLWTFPLPIEEGEGEAVVEHLDQRPHEKRGNQGATPGSSPERAPMATQTRSQPMRTNRKGHRRFSAMTMGMAS